MTAAEPARSPEPTPANDAGAVIHLAQHLAARARASGRPKPDVSNCAVEQELAETMEALFLARGLTLTDPQTAHAFDTTIEAMLLMVDGARVHDALGESDHQNMRGMLEGMKAAPQRV